MDENREKQPAVEEMICDIAAAGFPPRSSGRILGYVALVGGDSGGSLGPEQTVDICHLNLSSLIVNALALAGITGALIYASWNFMGVIICWLCIICG